MGSGLKFLFPRTLFLALVVLIMGEGILVLVCVALKWYSIDTFNFQNNLNFSPHWQHRMKQAFKLKSLFCSKTPARFTSTHGKKLFFSSFYLQKILTAFDNVQDVLEDLGSGDYWMIYFSLTTALRGIVLALRICFNFKIQITVFCLKSLNIQACGGGEVTHQLDVWTCPPTNCWLGIICKHNKYKSPHKWSLSELCHSRTKRTKYWQPTFGWVT